MIDSQNGRAVTAPTEAEQTAPQAGENPKLEMSTSRNFAAWLADQNASIAFSTYQAGKLFMLGSKPTGGMAVFERTIERCMGLAYHQGSLFVSSLYQLWRFENLMAKGEVRDGFDACFAPQMSWVTGDLDIHDMGFTKDGLTFVNTLFSCLARPSDTASFAPVWRPQFISRLAAEDRCHLNGLALADGEARYVTAVGQGDVADSWRDARVDGGVLIDVASNEIVLSGLSMPHSPRLYDGALYLLDSGNGVFARVDTKAGKLEEICLCPGYARGMAFVGKYAVIGLSLPRDNKTFSGLPLDDVLAEKKVSPRCGLMVVDLETGDSREWLRLDGVVNELYDISIIPGVRNPSLVGFKTDEIKRVIKVGDAQTL